MNSAKCPECGFVGWADAEFCKKCGAAIMSDSGDYSDQPAPSYASPSHGYTYQNQYAALQPQLKQGLAIAALVLGILNFLGFGIFIVTIIVGIVVSVMALSRIKRFPLKYGGKSLAVAGLVTNLVSVVMLIPFVIIAAIALPNLLAARMAANEGSALYSLRQISAAEQTYTSRYNRFASLTDLQQAQLVSDELATGTRHGYQIKVEVVADRGDGFSGFAAVATPVIYGSSGRRSFFIDESGVIRASDSHGADATKYDRPVRSGAERSGLRNSQGDDEN